MGSSRRAPIAERTDHHGEAPDLIAIGLDL